MANNNKAYALALIGAVVMVVVLAEAPPSSAAATCDITELLPCAGAFLSENVAPAKECCTKLEEQQPCLCEYKAKYQNYANSPAAKRVVTACNVKVSC